jgi:hypothetical protein
MGSGTYRGADRRSPGERRPSDYRGPDRRGTAGAQPPGSGFLRAVAFGGALGVFTVGAVRASMLGGRGLVVTFAALRDTSAGLLVLAGTVLLVLWALTGRAARALDGSALLLAGGGLLVLAGPWGTLLHTNANTALVSPACRVALAVPALVLLIRSPSLCPVDSSVRPIRTLASAATCSLLLLGVEALIRTQVPLDQPLVWIALMAALSIGWVAAGAQRFGLDERPGSLPGERALGWALIAFGLGDVLVAVALDTNLHWAVAGVAIQAIGAAGASAVAVSWLLTLLNHDSDRRLRLVGELSEVRTVLADEQSGRHRLVHDARNVVAAIRTASGTLERHGGRLDPDVQDRLRTAVGSEFERLLQLLDQRAG